MSATPDDSFHLSIDIVREIHAEALEKFGGLKSVRDEKPARVRGAGSAIELRRQIALPRYRGGSSGVFVLHLPQSSVSRWEQADRDDGGDRLPEVEGIEPVLDSERWEQLMLDVAASKVDRDATTRRLRKLVKPFRKR